MFATLHETTQNLELRYTISGKQKIEHKHLVRDVLARRLAAWPTHAHYSADASVVCIAVLLTATLLPPVHRVFFCSS